MNFIDPLLFIIIIIIIIIIIRRSLPHTIQAQGYLVQNRRGNKIERYMPS